MSPINLAIVGVGKIVRDQHLPAVAKNSDYKLIAAASRHGVVNGIDNFKSIDEMLAAVPAIQAVSLCMPPQYRYEAAEKALSAGKHVFLESRRAPRCRKSPISRRWPPPRVCRCLPAGTRAMRRPSKRQGVSSPAPRCAPCR